MDLMREYTRKLKSGRVMLYLAAVLAVSVSCHKDSPVKQVELEDFVLKQECGLVGYGGYLFKYTDKNCQLGVNIRRRMLRMQNDMQTDYVHILFSRLPRPQDASVGVDLLYKVGEDEIMRSVQMTSVKYGQGKVWLWDASSSMGLIVPVKW